MSKLQVQDFQQFTDYVTEVSEFYGGGQIIFSFPNGYGASLVNHGGSYGNEMAVLKNDEICYDTIVTDDVLPHLSQHEIIDKLHAIKNLTGDNLLK